MDQSEDPRELERKIEQAARIASSVTDQTTVLRLRALVQHLEQKLRELLESRRINQQILARARELWEQNGRPPDRDLEFWLQAESEISERKRESNRIGERIPARSLLRRIIPDLSVTLPEFDCALMGELPRSLHRYVFALTK